MAALRKKYKNDKQTLNQETMKLYQEAGVNPLMGCLPVRASAALFFALFSVLRAIAEWNTGHAEVRTADVDGVAATHDPDPGA
jgi:YidC/Oxa1 family membrane protein insertase